MPDRSDTLLVILEMVGTIAFSLSGALAARRAKMDWAGVILLGVLVAVGGGTLRDVLVGRLPVSWIDDGWPVPLAAGTALVTIHPIVPHVMANRRAIRQLVLGADAVGLATFSVVGASIGLGAGTRGWVAAVLGVMTGVFGGIFRDVMINERPAVLTGDIYVLAAILGAGLHVLLAETGVTRWLTIWIPVLAALALRLLVLVRRWSTRPAES